MTGPAVREPAVTELIDGYGLVEGPTLAPDGSIVFSDVTKGGVHRWRADGPVETLIPRRRGVGGLCLHVRGGIVMGGRDLSHVLDGVTRTLLTPDALPGVVGAVNGFSDLCADSRGRVLAGLGRRRADGSFAPGRLVVLGPDGVEDQDVPEVGLPNGIAVSGDGRWLYQSDSELHLVVRYRTLTDGRIERDGDFSTAEFGGIPDGLAADERGGLWVAMYGGGCVVEFDPHVGAVRRVFRIAARNPPSLVFAGRDLVVATAEGDGAPRGGGLLRFPIDVAGAPVHPAAV